MTVSSNLHRCYERGTGSATGYTHGDRDLMTAQVPPVSGTTTYAYNDHGELTSEIDARGVAMGRTVVLDEPLAARLEPADLRAEKRLRGLLPPMQERGRSLAL